MLKIKNITNVKMSNWAISPEYNENYCNKISYVVPMSERASVATTMAMQNSNQKIATNKLTKNFNNSIQNVTSFADAAAYGGMSLWFLLVAVLICVILFSGMYRFRGY